MARVLAAMSGGVDSSVICALLAKEGHEVMGATMLLLSADKTAEAADARAVCERLGVPHRMVDLVDRFHAEVVDRFCNAYLAGETPNPCVDCNRCLKFGSLHDVRKELGCDYLATGHYVRRRFDEQTGRYVLEMAADPKKDQSYFLYGLTQEQLAHALFPLGDLTKEKVRQLAREAGFVTAEKAESQDICFIDEAGYAAFIEARVGGLPGAGPIVLEDGTCVGEHQGLVHYTPGQRKGLGVAWSEPLYVLRKDVVANSLVVGPASSQGIHEVWAKDPNFVSVAGLEGEQGVQAKVNYRAKPVPARASLDPSGLLHVVFEEPVRSCAPGQAVVLYQGSVVLGGGTIAKCR